MVTLADLQARRLAVASTPALPVPVEAPAPAPAPNGQGRAPSPIATPLDPLLEEIVNNAPKAPVEQPPTPAKAPALAPKQPPKPRPAIPWGWLLGVAAVGAAAVGAVVLAGTPKRSPVRPAQAPPPRPLSPGMAWAAAKRAAGRRVM